MLANAAPRQGDVYLRFNGLNNFVEIPSIADYSVAATGELIQRVESKRVDKFARMSDEELERYVNGNRELDS